MTVNNFSIKSAVLITTLSLSLAAQAGIRTAGKTPVADEAKQTLEDLQMSATAVENQADELRTFIDNPHLSPESHIDKLIAMREEINRMGREMHILDTERGALPSWEQQAVDKTLPLLKDSAANTTSAIEYLNTNRTHLWGDEYRGYADSVWQDSEQMAKTLKNYLKLAKLRQEEQPLENTLGQVAATR
jgi:hypothetical protein